MSRLGRKKRGVSWVDGVNLMSQNLHLFRSHKSRWVLSWITSMCQEGRVSLCNFRTLTDDSVFLSHFLILLAIFSSPSWKLKALYLCSPAAQCFARVVRFHILKHTLVLFQEILRHQRSQTLKQVEIAFHNGFRSGCSPSLSWIFFRIYLKRRLWMRSLIPVLLRVSLHWSFSRYLGWEVIWDRSVNNALLNSIWISDYIKLRRIRTWRTRGTSSGALARWVLSSTILSDPHIRAFFKTGVKESFC